MTFTEYDLFIIVDKSGYRIPEFEGLVYISEDVSQMIADDYNKRNNIKPDSYGEAMVYCLCEYIEMKEANAIDRASYR